MRKITHITALAELANAIHLDHKNKNESPISSLSQMLGLHIQSHRFVKILTWMIAFYNEAQFVLDEADLTDKTRSAAKSNISLLFSPFLPPFGGNTVSQWYTSSMSQTNQSYFDLLSDTLVKSHFINLPGEEEVCKFKDKLRGLLQEMEAIGLPKWINDDFKESIEITYIALDKMPFIAHKILQESNNTILARLFSPATQDQKRFMVQVATAMNIIFAAFVMPHEAAEAANAYYGWMMPSSVPNSQIEEMAKPLALPAPSSVSTSSAKGKPPLLSPELK